VGSRHGGGADGPGRGVTRRRRLGTKQSYAQWHTANPQDGGPLVEGSGLAVAQPGLPSVGAPWIAPRDDVSRRQQQPARGTFQERKTLLGARRPGSRPGKRPLVRASTGRALPTPAPRTRKITWGRPMAPLTIESRLEGGPKPGRMLLEQGRWRAWLDRRCWGSTSELNLLRTCRCGEKEKTGGAGGRITGSLRRGPARPARCAKKSGLRPGRRRRSTQRGRRRNPVGGARTGSYAEGHSAGRSSSANRPAEFPGRQTPVAGVWHRPDSRSLGGMAVGGTRPTGAEEGKSGRGGPDGRPTSFFFAHERKDETIRRSGLSRRGGGKKEYRLSSRGTAPRVAGAFGGPAKRKWTVRRSTEGECLKEGEDGTSRPSGPRGAVRSRYWIDAPWPGPRTGRAAHTLGDPVAEIATGRSPLRDLVLAASSASDRLAPSRFISSPPRLRPRTWVAMGRRPAHARRRPSRAKDHRQPMGHILGPQAALLHQAAEARLLGRRMRW